MPENQRKNCFRERMRLLRYLNRTVQILVEVGPADSAIGVPQQNLVGAANFRTIYIFHPQVFTGVKTKGFHGISDGLARRVRIINLLLDALDIRLNGGCAIIGMD
jgi:hypothetical protein